MESYQGTSQGGFPPSLGTGKSSVQIICQQPGCAFQARNICEFCAMHVCDNCIGSHLVHCEAKQADGSTKDQTSSNEKKARRKRSAVWNHFTLEGEKYAICKLCGHVSTYISSNGTGGLRSHISRCLLAKAPEGLLALAAHNNSNKIQNTSVSNVPATDSEGSTGAISGGSASKSSVPSLSKGNNPAKQPDHLLSLSLLAESQTLGCNSYDSMGTHTSSVQLGTMSIDFNDINYPSAHPSLSMSPQIPLDTAGIPLNSLIPHGGSASSNNSVNSVNLPTTRTSASGTNKQQSNHPHNKTNKPGLLPNVAASFFTPAPWTNHHSSSGSNHHYMESMSGTLPPPTSSSGSLLPVPSSLTAGTSNDSILSTASMMRSPSAYHTYPPSTSHSSHLTTATTPTATAIQPITLSTLYLFTLQYHLPLSLLQNPSFLLALYTLITTGSFQPSASTASSTASTTASSLLSSVFTGLSSSSCPSTSTTTSTGTTAAGSALTGYTSQQILEETNQFYKHYVHSLKHFLCQDLSTTIVSSLWTSRTAHPLAPVIPGYGKKAHVSIYPMIGNKTHQWYMVVKIHYLQCIMSTSSTDHHMQHTSKSSASSAASEEWELREYIIGIFPLSQYSTITTNTSMGMMNPLTSSSTLGSNNLNPNSSSTSTVSGTSTTSTTSTTSSIPSSTSTSNTNTNMNTNTNTNTNMNMNTSSTTIAAGNVTMLTNTESKLGYEEQIVKKLLTCLQDFALIGKVLSIQWDHAFLSYAHHVNGIQGNTIMKRFMERYQLYVNTTSTTTATSHSIGAASTPSSSGTTTTNTASIPTLMVHNKCCLQYFYHLMTTMIFPVLQPTIVKLRMFIIQLRNSSILQETYYNILQLQNQQRILRYVTSKQLMQQLFTTTSFPEVMKSSTTSSTSSTSTGAPGSAAGVGGSTGSASMSNTTIHPMEHHIFPVVDQPSTSWLTTMEMLQYCYYYHNAIQSYFNYILHTPHTQYHGIQSYYAQHAEYLLTTEDWYLLEQLDMIMKSLVMTMDVLSSSGMDADSVSSMKGGKGSSTSSSSSSSTSSGSIPKGNNRYYGHTLHLIYPALYDIQNVLKTFHHTMQAHVSISSSHAHTNNNINNNNNSHSSHYSSSTSSSSINNSNNSNSYLNSNNNYQTSHNMNGEGSMPTTTHGSHTGHSTPVNSSTTMSMGIKHEMKDRLYQLSNELLTSFHQFFHEDLWQYYAVGLILDPGCKLEYIRETLGPEMANQYYNLLRTILTTQYSHVQVPMSSSSEPPQHGSSNSIGSPSSTSSTTQDSTTTATTVGSHSVTMTTPPPSSSVFVSSNSSTTTTYIQDKYFKRRRTNDLSSIMIGGDMMNNSGGHPHNSSLPVKSLFQDHSNTTKLPSNTTTTSSTAANHHQQMMIELDAYLHAALILNNEKEFNIWEWWEANAIEYPHLAQLAQDYLAMPTCLTLLSTIALYPSYPSASAPPSTPFLGTLLSPQTNTMILPVPEEALQVSEVITSTTTTTASSTTGSASSSMTTTTTTTTYTQQKEKYLHCEDMCKVLMNQEVLQTLQAYQIPLPTVSSEHSSSSQQQPPSQTSYGGGIGMREGFLKQY